MNFKPWVWVDDTQTIKNISEHALEMNNADYCAGLK